MGCRVITILSAALATGAGASFRHGADYRPRRTFQAVVAGSGAVTATVLIEVSLDEVDWITIATFTLNGTNRAADLAAVEGAYPFVRANVSAITGSSAAVTVIMGS